MTSPETLERELIGDLEGIGDRLADERFCGDLYRALGRMRWRKEGLSGGYLSLSFARAEELVNELRARRQRPAMTLAQTGGEGEVAASVAEELGRLGWRAEPLDTSRRDERHVGRPAQPPPAGQGEARSPAEDSHRWEREAHEQADRSALRRR